MDQIRNKNLDLILIDGGKLYLEKGLPFSVTVLCKVTNEWNSEINICYRRKAEVRAAMSFEFKDIKISASLHNFNFGVNQDEGLDDDYDDYIGMQNKNPYNFERFIENEIKRNFNKRYSEYKNGMHIGRLYNKLTMLDSLIGESILSPKFKDGWLFGGFSLKKEIYDRERAKKQREKELKKNQWHQHNH